MKNSFFGYYAPSAEQFERLWREGLIVLDTNVLLNLYRLPTTARSELFTVLELLKDRLWIPYQVALEFQRRRLTVIASERKVSEEALKSAKDFVSDLKQKVEALQIDKHGLGIDAKSLVEDLEKANTKLLSAIEAVHKSQLDIASSDPIRDRLDTILHAKVGNAPRNQAELDGYTAGGEDRFKDRIPPGFADAEKDKNPAEATFVHDHIRYQRKFGDLILWRQLIEHVKNVEAKTVLLVTADKKDDWWWREQGKTIGAHPELVREISREGAVELFWMYSSVQFMGHATKYTAAKVSKQSMAELEEIVRSVPQENIGFSRESGQEFPSSTRSPQLIDEKRSTLFYHKARKAVAHWLTGIYGKVVLFPKGFPDLVVELDGEHHGYEIRLAADLKWMLTSLQRGLRQGALHINDSYLKDLAIVIVTTEQNYFDIFGAERREGIRHTLSKLANEFPSTNILVGAVIGEEFRLIAHSDPKFD